MMTGCVYVVMGPTSFLAGFVISEIIALISNVKKEGLLMVSKALETLSRSFVKCTKKHVIASWEAHLPYRRSLLMSLCNSSEKGTRERAA
jgi:hypothetical protein